MLTERRTWLALLACLALTSGVLAQEESSPPSFTERLSRFGRSLFDRAGAEEPPHREELMGDESGEFSEEAPNQRAGSVAGQGSRPAQMTPPNEAPPQRANPANPASARARNPGANVPRTSAPTASAAPQTPQTPPPAMAAPKQRSSRRTAQPGFEPSDSSMSGAPARAPSATSTGNPWEAPPAAPPAIARQATPPARTNPAPIAQRPAPAKTTPPASRPIAQKQNPLVPQTLPASEPAGEFSTSDSPAGEFSTSDSSASELPVVTDGRSLQGRIAKAREDEPAPATMANETMTNESPAPAANPIRPKASSRIAKATPMRNARALSEKSTDPEDAPTLFEQQSPILAIHASGPQKIKVGTVSLFTISIDNAASVDAEEVVVTVRVPEGADVANTHPQAGTVRPGSSVDGSPTIEWSIPRLAGRETSTLSIGLIPRKSQPFDLTATWTHAPVSSLASIDVQEAKLVMTLSGPDEVFFGERELYKLTISNPGNGDAENVMVRLLPTTPSEDQAVSHQIGTLAAGENRVVELELTARQVGNLRLKAEAVADGGLLASVDEEVIVRRADLKINVEGPSLLYAGTIGVYRIHVSNPGNAVAKNVQVSAMLPAGATFVGCSDGGVFGQEHGRIVWTTSNLRPGAEWSCSYRCELTHPGPNTAQVTAIAEGDLRQSFAAETEVEALADLTLTVKDPPGPMPVGQDAQYEVRVKNRGTKAADNVEVVAFFSPGIEPTEVEGGPYELGPGQIALAPIATLAPGQEMVFKIRAKAHRSGNHVFRAEVECSALETKLAAEETTRFYGDDVSAEEPVPTESAPAEPAAEAPAENYEPEPVEPGELTPSDDGDAPLVPAPSSP